MRFHRELKRRARTRGETLTDYVQGILEREVARPPAEEVFERIRSREPVDLGPGEVLDDRGRVPRAEAVRAIVEDPDIDVHVPALCDVEVACGLRRLLLSRRMSVARATEAVEDYLDLRLVRHGHESLIAPILERRANFTAYDATYLTLAETLGAALLSTDRRLLRGAARHTDVRSAMTG